MTEESIQKPHLVFLHYFGGAAESWKWTIDALKETFDCTAINFPRFGNTEALKERTILNYAKYVLEKIKTNHSQNCVLIGHSMGGKIALQAAALDTEKRIAQLILIAPSPPTTEPMKEEEKERMLQQNREQAEITVQKSTGIELDPEKFKLGVETQLMEDHQTWKWWIEEGMAHSILDQISLIQTPITVLSSTEEPVMTPEVIQERVMQHLPNARFIKTTKIGHLIPMEAPEWTAKTIKKNILNQSL